MKITVLGLGEAGGRYAVDLAAAGHSVTGYDPGASSAPAGVRLSRELSDAVSSAELVIVLTPASLSVRLAEDGRAFLQQSSVWADFTSAGPDEMAEAASLFPGHGAEFADVAILGPVPAKGALTDLIVSGRGADAVRSVFTKVGASVEMLDSPAGDATARKLLRSVIMKSLAAVACEAIAAGNAAGCEDWVRNQLDDQLANDGAMVERFITGARQHAERRAHEMRSTVEYLEALGVPTEMSAAAEQSLLRMHKENLAITS
jgi:3-hydroxyisobutyrate dehydrogenase